MTLADRVAAALEQMGTRNPRQAARFVIAEVRDHDSRLLEQLRPRPMPYDDCPDGCVVGAEWRRRALHAEEVRDGR